MTHQEVELWTQDLVAAVLANQRIEDSKVELKASWPEPRKAADRLAGHANAARGSSVLWLIGVDEKNCKLTNVDPVEVANWLRSVESFFDGFAPRLAIDVNVRIDGKRANNLVTAALTVPSQHQQPKQLDEAWKAVRSCAELIEKAREAMSRF